MRLFHCTWKAVLGRRLASPICAFHLGISLVREAVNYWPRDVTPVSDGADKRPGDHESTADLISGTIYIVRVLRWFKYSGTDHCC